MPDSYCVTLREIQQEVSSQIINDLSHVPEEVMPTLMIVGLTEEAGEVAGLLKRLIRGFPKDLERASEEHLTEELGDVLWYLAGTAYALNLSLEDIWSYNKAKLEERYGGQ